MNRNSCNTFFCLIAVLANFLLASCSSTENSDLQITSANSGTVNKSIDKTKSDYPPESPDIKAYSKMSEAEQNKFVAEQADKILQKLGFEKSEKVNGEGLELVKPFVDAYAKRSEAPKKDKCQFGDNLSEILKRGSKAAEDINAGFESADLIPEVGFYLAMIESEFCPCIQSPTGPLGMFQLTTQAAIDFGLDAKRGASPSSPDDRCNTNSAATAAAKIIRRNADKTEAGSIGVPVAIMRYSTGDETKYEVADELKNNPKSQESYWQLLVKTKTSRKREDKYLGKFIAAAIVGENPKVFGVGISPLSEVK